MLSPRGNPYTDIPPLVDPNHSPFGFQPAPPGASHGGQPGMGGFGFGGGGGGGGFGGGGGDPGFLAAFPGAAAAQAQQQSPWPGPFPGTPHPGSAGLNAPSGYPWGPSPHSAPPAPAPSPWGPGPFGGANPHYPAFNAGGGAFGGGGFGGGAAASTPALTWGAPTPAGSYGAPVTPGGAFGAGAGVFGGGGYTPWSAPPNNSMMMGGGAGDFSFGGGGGAMGGGSGITPGGFFGASTTQGPFEMGRKERKEREKAEKQRKRANSMKRSTSEGPPGWAFGGSSPGHLQRSNSFGHSLPQTPGPFGPALPYYPPFAPNAWGADAGGVPTNEIYGPRNLARRPRDWRADYSWKGGLGSWVGAVVVGRDRSDVNEVSDPKRRNLHPLMQYTTSRPPPLQFDLRHHPFPPPTGRPEPNTLLFSNINRAHNEIDLAQVATEPATHFMRLYHPQLPWYVDIRQSRPNGVTIYDILAQLYRAMMTPITARHFYNEDFGDEGRAVVGRAYEVRIRGSADPEGERPRGVVQVDYLGEKCVLEGLVRGRNGMWEMKTRRPR